MIDRVLIHRVRDAIDAPINGSQPTVMQALVEFVRHREGADLTVQEIVLCIAAMNDYQRAIAVAKVWRRYQPDLSADALEV